MPSVRKYWVNSWPLMRKVGRGLRLDRRHHSRPAAARRLNQIELHNFDTGIKRALERTLEVPLRPATYEYGKAFEHFLVTQIVHLARYRYPDWRLSYLQTGAGAEIDLVIERPGLRTALIEIKSADGVDERDVRTLARFSDHFGDPLALCISRDPARMQIGGVRCVHWREALTELALA